MKLVKKGEAPKADDAEAHAAIASTPWDAAMAMLATGEYEVVPDPNAERGPDQPSAQMPSPGVEPVEKAPEPPVSVARHDGEPAPEPPAPSVQVSHLEP